VRLHERRRVRQRLLRGLRGWTAPVSAGCWADPLSRQERAVLSRKLARTCRLFYAASRGCGRRGEIKMQKSLVQAATDMGDLHMDVTERAGVPAS
jgi:hypothetical protein